MSRRAFLLATHLVVLFLLLPLSPRGSEVFASATPHGILFSSLEETALLANIQNSLTEYYGDNYTKIEPDEQMGLLLLRSSFRNKVLDRASGIVVGESVKAVLAILKIKGKITEATAESIFTEAEKLGVQEGIAYVNSVLLQNQVKVASGEVRMSIKGREGLEDALFQYIIVVDQENKEMVVELYSSDSIVLPVPVGHTVIGMKWDYGSLRIQRHGSNRVSPFIFRMQTKVEQRKGAWSIADSGRMKLEMLYPEEVPRLEIAKELPYLLEGYKREILNILQIGERFFELPARHLSRIMDGLRQIAQGVGKIATNISSSIFGAFSDVFALGGGGMGLQIYTEQSGRIPVVVSSETDQKETEGAPQQAIQQTIAETQQAQLPNQAPLLNEEQNKPIIREQEKFSPLASVLYPPELFVDKEVVVTVRLSGMDPSKEYDIRVGIEAESVLSDAFHQTESRWKSSTFYIPQVAQKVSSIAKDVRLRVRQEHQKFEGRANIVVRLREQGKTGAVLFLGPISLVVPKEEEKEMKTETEEEQELSCVNINMASLGDLTRITQVGRARAEQIMALRQESPFNSLDDLARVSGIGAATVATIKAQGLACVEGEAVKEPEDKNQEPEENLDAKQSVPCVNINTASKEDLLRISRIGEARASQILSLRQQALFSSVQDLVRVSGIGSIIVQAIQEQKLACVGSEAPIFMPAVSAPASYQREESSDENQEKEFFGCEEGQININTAESEELQMISEIGPSYASQIMALRQEESFWSLDDLDRVSGISAGGSRLATIKEQGLACAGPLDYVWVEEEGEEESSDEDEELVFVAPGTPQTQTPTTNTTPSWTWEVAQSSAGEIEEYLVEWSQDSEFAEGVSSATTQEPLFVHETALEQGTWYLRVKAKDTTDSLSLFSDSGMVTVESPSHAVVINEIAWMGTKASPQHEWIELYNNTTEEINLSGWSIKAEDGTPDINLDGTIESLGFFLLERTSQDTISDVDADLTYTGALNDSGEYLRLYDANNVLVDEIDALSGWEELGGKKDERISMERINPLELGSSAANWTSNTLFVRNGIDKNGEPVNGTPGEKNSVLYEKTIISQALLTQLYKEFNEITISTYGGTYVAQGDIYIPQEKTLAIKPGVTLKLNIGKQIIVHGTLLAQGTEDLPILFTRAENSAWNGIRFFETSSGDSEISHAVIEGGLYKPNFPQLGAERRFNIGIEGSSPTIRNVSFISGSTVRGAIFLYNSNSLIENVEIRGAHYKPYANSINTAAIFIVEGSPTIKSSTFYDNDVGVYVHGPLASPTITENTFEKGVYPVYLNGSYATILGNEVLDHTYHAIATTGSIRDSAAVWESDNLPFLLISTFGVWEGAVLSVVPGTTVLFANPDPYPILFGVYGTLKAEGTEESPVLFSDYSSWSGGSAKYWRYIQFYPSSTGSVISHAVIQNGGAIITGNASYGLLYVQKSELELLNVTLKNGKRYEMVIENVAENAVFGSDVLILHNESSSYEAIRVIGETCPVFANMEIQGGSIFAQNSPCQ